MIARRLWDEFAMDTTTWWQTETTATAAAHDGAHRYEYVVTIYKVYVSLFVVYSSSSVIVVSSSSLLLLL
jgi:hypothetical protein